MHRSNICGTAGDVFVYKWKILKWVVKQRTKPFWMQNDWGPNWSEAETTENHVIVTWSSWLCTISYIEMHDVELDLKLVFGYIFTYIYSSLLFFFKSLSTSIVVLVLQTIGPIYRLMTLNYIVLKFMLMRKHGGAPDLIWTFCRLVFQHP